MGCKTRVHYWHRLDILVYDAVYTGDADILSALLVAIMASRTGVPPWR